jgi:hypothetical protein
VSPLWRDELRIWLAPGEVRIRRLRRGLRPACVADATQVIDSTSDWRPALAALGPSLGPLAHGARARVVVSNRLARYAIVPWSDTLTREAELLAHARICLAESYGNTGPEWRVCISESSPGDAHVACALPAELVAQLRALLEAHRVPLLSVQPALIAAFNGCRQRLPQSACWFVNIEASVLVAARLAPRGWAQVYSARIGANWSTELLRLRTFARLAAQNSADARVFVTAPASLRRMAQIDEPDIEWLETADESAGDTEHRHSVRLRT